MDLKKEYFRSFKTKKFQFKFIQVLKYGAVINGVYQQTDLNQWLFISDPCIKKAEGTVYVIESLKKTADFDKSEFKPSEDETKIKLGDFPTFVKKDIKFKKSIPFDIVNALPDFQNYAGKDGTTRTALTGVCIDADKQCIVSADGHVLRLRKDVKLRGKGQYIVPLSAVEFIKAMKKFELRKAGIGKGKKNSRDFFVLEYVHDDTVITFCAELIDGPYPDYEKCFNSEMCDRTMTLEDLTGNLEVIKKLTDLPLHKEHKKQSYLICKGKEFYWRSQEGAKVVKAKKSFVRGNVIFNTRLIVPVLKDIIKTGHSSINTHTPELKANIFDTDLDTYVVMPVHPIGDEQEVIESAVYLSN